MGRLIREPLLQFLAIGVALFALSPLVDRDRPEVGGTITIDAGLREALRQQWTRQRGRPPTAAELEGLVESRVREEVLYREALALGLDQDDTIVRRRLAQKLEFLITDAAVPAEPDDATLRAYFEANRERYTAPPRRSFTHVYFSTDRRDDAAAAAHVALAELEDGSPSIAAELGDGFLLGHDFAGRSEAEVARDFGEAFARALFAVDGGDWSGPIASGYGLHLVRIDGRVAAAPRPFEAVREQVERDFLAATTREANQRAYERLRARYDVVIEPTSGAQAAAP